MPPRRLLPTKTLASFSLLLACLHSQTLSPVHAAGTGMAPLSAKVSHVIHIVVDGLRADSLLNAGHPAFDYLLHTGACTLNARHDDLSSQTLPNHIGMFTGLPVADHGYAEDKDFGPVNATATSNTATAAGTTSQSHSTLIDTETDQPFQSIFDVVSTSRATGTTNGRTAIFTSKSKFQLFDRSWPVSSYYENKKSKAVTRRFVNEMSNKHFAYSYLHVVDPDLNGHRYDGAATPQYADGVATASYRLSEVLDMIASHPILADDTALIVTADHGFSDYGNHADGDDPDVYHIPFCVWGPGKNMVTPHGNLYAINRANGSGLANPGNRKASGERVIRNTYAAPLAADLLGIHPAEGALGDQYMAVSDGSAPTEAALSWLEWKAAHNDEYDWTEPTEVEMDEAEELLLEESNDEEEAGTLPEISVPIKEVSKEEAQEDEDDVPVPIDAVEIIDTEEIPVPMDAEESINTEEIPVPFDIEKDAGNTEAEPVLMDVEEEEVSTVLIPPTEVSEDVAKANALPAEDDEPVETVEEVDADAKAKDESSDTRGVQEQNESRDSISESQATSFQISEGGSFVSCDWVVKKPELVEYRCGRTAFDGVVVKDLCPDECADYGEDEIGIGPDISAFIAEDTTSVDNAPSQETGRSGSEIGLIAASAVAVLALVIAVYIYTTTSKAKAEVEVAENAGFEKAGGRTTKLDETRVSISSGGSDDGTDNLFSGYASSSTFDEESCIDVGRSSSMESRSFSRSTSLAAMHNSRRFTFDEAANAHVQAIEAGAWPDDVVPFEAVEVCVTENSKTVWHVVDLAR